MVKIELDINGISFFVNTTWKTDAVPAVGDIVIVDKESIFPPDRAELRKTPSNQAFKWADEEDDAPVLECLSKNGRGNLMPKMKKWCVC